MGLRIEVADFAQAMETILLKNDHKGGWDDMDLSELFLRLREETFELKRAISEFEKEYNACCSKGPVWYREYERRVFPYVERIRTEAVDVANFAMMIWKTTIDGLKEKP